MHGQVVCYLQCLLLISAISLPMLLLSLQKQMYDLLGHIVLNFVFLSFEFVSYFDIRNSDLIILFQHKTFNNLEDYTLMCSELPYFLPFFIPIMQVMLSCLKGKPLIGVN